MHFEHHLPESLRKSSQPLNTLVVGAGGNGSAIFLHLPYLHQALRVWGHAGINATIVDGDQVSETNCVRQPFASADVGLNKATVLANRVNLFWGLRWRAVPENFRHNFLDNINDHTDLLISCVDTRAARQAIAEAVTSHRNGTAYWLDLGNNAASGQFVLGQPRNRRNRMKAERLHTVVELYPDIAASQVGEDPLPSCSAIEALERQEPFINQVLATSSLAMLSRLLRYGSIAYHGAFYNATSGRMSIMPIDRDVWRKTRRRSLSLLKRSLKPTQPKAAA